MTQYSNDEIRDSVPHEIPEGYARFACVVEYDGTGFAGLQIQDNSVSIQQKFEDMGRTFGIDDCNFRASGRTDAGVHARGQVVCITLPESILSKSIERAMNWHLPGQIRVRKAVPCQPEFDPRRAARMRTYRYLLCSHQALPPLMQKRMGRFSLRLDIEKMRAAAEAFKGEHDFQAWRSTMCQANRTVLNIQKFQVEPWRDRAPHGEDDTAFEVTISCRSFLHRMVRFLIGGLVRAGSGKLPVEELVRHLENGTLPDKATPAPASGLSLEHVEYPPEVDPFRKENQPERWRSQLYQQKIPLP